MGTKIQGKVSMIVPCYNKEAYIGEMLNSVIAQEWNNIELLLVNDGSTDGTRDLIISYLPKLRKRGYEVKLLDQENGGCCRAVYTGLINMTGDYYCLVDCDDAIEPKYVSRMAGWLDAYEEYDWATCGFKRVMLQDGKKTDGGLVEFKYRMDTDNLLEKYILRETCTTVWIILARTSYLKKCGLLDNFCVQRKMTYEPLIMLPLANGNGKMEFFNEPLYLYNQEAIELFRFSNFKKCQNYYTDYRYLNEWVINRLNVSNNKRNRLLLLAKFAYFGEIFSFIGAIPDGKGFVKENAEAFVELLNDTFKPNTPFTTEWLILVGCLSVFKYVSGVLLNTNSFRERKKFEGKIIGYGALGKQANLLLPLLKESNIEPTELWDKKGDGKVVMLPDFAELTENDTFLILPKAQSIVSEINQALEKTTAKIFTQSDILYTLIEDRFAHLQIVRD